MSAVGTPVTRVDGPAKVTGAARYTAELAPPRLTHLAIVGATVASGRVTAIDAEQARVADGVLAVLTHENLPAIPGVPRLLPSLLGQAAPGMSFFPLQDDVVHYAGQPVALVVADSHERAQHAAGLVRVSYDAAPPIATIDAGREDAYEPERLFGGLMPGRVERGDVDAALGRADTRIDVAVRMAANHHNPMEAPSTLAEWDGDRLTIHESTMGVRATQLTVAHLLGLPLAHVRVLAPFVGGSFGMKAMVWPGVTLAAIAAREVGRPVRLMLTRPQMFTSNGHREEQEQRLVLGATREGRLTAIDHAKLSLGSPFDDWAEPATGVSSQLYAVGSYRGVHRLVRGNTMTPTFTRGPGEALGVSMLEMAMDELAHALGIDPVELRLRNHTPVDPHGNAWSSDGLPECLRLGAERFGWAGRDPAPRSTRDGDWLIGSGMAAAAYPIAFFMPEQRARARIHADGSAMVQTATQEFGTGVLTMATQVGADALGVELDAMTFQGGDSDLPNSSAAVGSMGATMVSAAVHNAADALRRRLVELAIGDEASPLHGVGAESVAVAGGRMTSAERPGAGETYGELLARGHMADLEAMGSWRPPPFDGPHGMLTFGAQFAEVAVDPELGLVRARRLARGVRAGPRPQPAPRSQPARERDALGPRAGAARRQPHGSAPRPLGGEQPRRVPRAGQRRRPRRDDRVRRRARRRSSARSAPRASARSARSAPSRRSPTRCSTPPDAACASCRWRPSW